MRIKGEGNRWYKAKNRLKHRKTTKRWNQRLEVIVYSASFYEKELNRFSFGPLVLL